MINTKVCIEYIEELLNDIYYSEIDNIKNASKLITAATNNGGNICFFGQGHSVWVGLDVCGKYDLPIKVLKEDTDDALKLYEENNIKENDIFVIVSNSGINTFIVELASIIKKHNHKLIVINSYKHAMNTDSRHISKRKLYEFGDVVIDNCCVYGDAAIKDNEKYIGSFSSIANNVIVHSILKDIS